MLTSVITEQFITEWDFVKILCDTEFVDKFIKDYKKADISKQDNTMLDNVVKLTKEPWNIVRADIQSLPNAGFSDEGILDIVQVAGYYTYVKRLADGLGVELESNSDENQSFHRSKTQWYKSGAIY